MAEQEVNQSAFMSTVVPVTAPAVPHCQHPSPPDTNHTCKHAATQSYNDNNLPPLLFQLDPPNERSTNLIPNLVENGQEVKAYDGMVIRDFPFLPRYISARPLAWQLEFWMRLDYRVTYRDIKARMTIGKALLPSDNSLNMRREREARTPLGLSCWTTRRGGVTRTEIERVDKLSHDQVLLNTTMDVVYSDEPVNGRTAVPKCLRARNLAGTPPACYPRDMFLVNQRLHAPGTRLAEALALHEHLMEAVAHSNVNDWRELPRDLLPSSWARRGGDDQHRGAARPSNISRGLTPQPTQGTGGQVNWGLVGPKDRANNDNDQQAGTTRLLSPFQGPAFSTQATRNDQATWAGQANITSGFNGYNTWGGMEQGNLPIPAAAGFPNGFQMPGMGYGFEGMHHGLPAPGTTFGSANYFGHQPNPFVVSNPPAYQPGYNPYAPHPFVAPTSYYCNPFAPHHQHHQQQQQQQQQQPQLIISMTQTTLPSRHHQPGPLTPQRRLSSNLQRVPGQNSSHHMDVGVDASAHPVTQNSSFTPTNQRQAEDESYRFNGSGPHSIRRNPAHRLNTDTDTVMQRNDPFERIQQGPGPFSSFDDFLEDQM